MLRCMNLLERPSSGDILYHNESIMTDKFNELEYRSKARWFSTV